MVSIIPSANLISNIGFGVDATHTQGASPDASMSVVPINFPLVHSRVVLPYSAADLFTARGMFSNSLSPRVMQKMEALLFSGSKA